MEAISPQIVSLNTCIADTDCPETNCCFKTICLQEIECRPSKGLSTPIVVIISIVALMMLASAIWIVVTRMKKDKKKQESSLLHESSRTEDLTGRTSSMSARLKVLNDNSP